MRALIGAFSANHLRFHDAGGAGYRLVGEVIRALDPINPQVAARLAGGFETWRRYDESRQASDARRTGSHPEAAGAVAKPVRSRQQDFEISLLPVRPRPYRCCAQGR